jgi:hypothetical protein
MHMNVSGYPKDIVSRHYRTEHNEEFCDWGEYLTNMD